VSLNPLHLAPTGLGIGRHSLAAGTDKSPPGKEKAFVFRAGLASAVDRTHQLSAGEIAT
jgi:hypothetical protein